MKEVKFDYIYRNTKGELLSTKLTLDEIEKGIRGASSILCEFVATRQFVGLKDKNGNDIFEGDIVRISIDDNVLIKEVEPIKCGLNNTFLRNSFSNDEWEVIGNIYSNPELIGEH